MKSRLHVDELRRPKTRASLAPKTSVANGNVSVANGDVSVVANRPTAGQRRPWMEEEEAELYRGVLQYGVGNWAQIRLNGNFNERTNVHLKDKWRTLLKPRYRSQLIEYRSMYGRIPNLDY